MAFIKELTYYLPECIVTNDELEQQLADVLSWASTILKF